jgi:hypothetical protein
MSYALTRRLIPAVAALAVLIASLAIITPASASTAPAPLPCSPSQGDALSEQGGPVVAIASVYLVYWGSYWRTTGGINTSKYLS